MPLSVDRIVEGVKGDLESKGFKFDDLAFTRDFLTMLVTQIVNEIKANAIVSGPVTITSVTAVTVGAGVSGPGTGTISTGRVT